MAHKVITQQQLADVYERLAWFFSSGPVSVTCQGEQRGKSNVTVRLGQKDIDLSVFHVAAGTWYMTIWPLQPKNPSFKCTYELTPRRLEIDKYGDGMTLRFVFYR
jgi:hypothetical protein